MTDHSTTAAGEGGVTARRAVARWAWRLLRREWRGQALVLALLTLAVAAAVGGAAAAYNLAPAAGNARLGTANHALEYAEPDASTLQDDLPAARAWFGAVDVIGRQLAPLPGLFDQVELRAQDPRGPYGAPMLALVDGRFPSGAGDLAVTDGVAETLGVAVGETVELLGTPRTVVGTVENPSDLHDEFALVSPPHAGPPDSVTMLLGGTDDELQTFRSPSGASVTAVARQDNEGALAAVGALVAATVVLMLVALVAAAGFVVMAHRRLRQLGMLAAVGATEQHLRLVMVANGAFIGTIAAVIGVTLGLVAWIAAVPALEPVVGHRIEALNVPWWVVSAAMLLAIVAATGAA